MKTPFVKDFVFLVVIAILISFLVRSCEEQNNAEKLFKASNDSLHQTINKLGQQETTTAVLYGKYEDLQNEALSKDSSIAKLQAIVNKRTITATVFGVTTKSSGSTKTTVIEDTSKKSIDCPDSCKIYPTYVSDWEDRWEKGKIVANKDTIRRDIFLFNDFDITQEHSKWYKKPSVDIKVVNKNPKTITRELKTYTVKPKSPKRVIWAVAGMFVGLVGGVWLAK